MNFFKKTGGTTPAGQSGKNYLSPAPHAVPQAAGFSSGLSPAPQAVPQAAALASGLSPAPQAVPQAAGFSSGLSPAPQAVPQAAAAFASPFFFQPNKFDSAICMTSCSDFGVSPGVYGKYSTMRNFSQVRTFL
jgi:hypothetical protein